MSLLTTIPIALMVFMLERVECFSLLGVRNQSTLYRIWSMHVRVEMAASSSFIDLQSDSSLYGRGDRHLSAMLEEGDLVVYQTGTWFVDGVEVGDGTAPNYEYALVENVQVVWTHNCEHGVIRGAAVEALETSSTNEPRRFVLVNPMESIEFGPEQLVARVGVKWDESEDEGVCLGGAFDESLWRSG